MTELQKDLDELYDIAWFNDINDGETSKMLSNKEKFCSKWQDYAPRLCQWIMDNELDPLGFDECKALFATEIQKADRLFSKAKRKKDIIDASSAFNV